MDLEGALDQQLEHVRIDGLLVEIVGAETDGLDRVLLVELAGHHDHLGGRGDLQGLEQRGHALGDALGVGRQPEILQHDRRLVPAHGGDGRRPRSAAVTTSYSSKHHLSCFCSPGSSSTISNVGLVLSHRTLLGAWPAGATIPMFVK